jgi:hypothetical protein
MLGFVFHLLLFSFYFLQGEKRGDYGGSSELADRQRIPVGLVQQVGQCMADFHK